MLDNLTVFPTEQIKEDMMGNHGTVTFAGSQGNFELNAFKPVIIYNVLQSIRLLADAVRCFNDNCVAGLEPGRKRIQAHVDKSLMLVTALAPNIGYDAAAEIAKAAHKSGTTLRGAAVASGRVTQQVLDTWVNAGAMTGLNTRR